MMQTSEESLPKNTPELLSSIIREEFEKVNGVMNDVVRTTSRVACFYREIDKSSDVGTLRMSTQRNMHGIRYKKYRV